MTTKSFCPGFISKTSCYRATTIHISKMSHPKRPFSVLIEILHVLDSEPVRWQTVGFFRSYCMCFSVIAVRFYFMVGKTVWAFWGVASSSRQRLVMVLRSVKNEMPWNITEMPFDWWNPMDLSQGTCSPTFVFTSLALVWTNPFTPKFKHYILPDFKEKCTNEVVTIGICISIFHLSELWKAKFFILCDVLILVGLQGKSEIDHSWEWKG